MWRYAWICEDSSELRCWTTYWRAGFCWYQSWQWSGPLHLLRILSRCWYLLFGIWITIPKVWPLPAEPSQSQCYALLNICFWKRLRKICVLLLALWCWRCVTLRLVADSAHKRRCTVSPRLIDSPLTPSLWVVKSRLEKLVVVHVWGLELVEG